MFTTTLNINGSSVSYTRDIMSPWNPCTSFGNYGGFGFNYGYSGSCFGYGYSCNPMDSFKTGLGVGVGYAAGITLIPLAVKGLSNLFNKINTKKA